MNTTTEKTRYVTADIRHKGPKTTDPNDAMPSTNSQRQANWRKRQRDEKTRLERDLESARAEGRRLAREQNRETTEQLAAANKKLAELAQQKDDAEAALHSLQRTNQRLNAQIRQLKKQVAGRATNGDNHLDEEVWETLLSFDQKQLRQWAMAGRRFAQKDDDSPVNTAMRWVTENRLD